MANNGWIKLHRKFLDWEWYKNATVKELFIHLLIKANHVDKRWQGTNVKRGQLVTSYQHLSQQTTLSVRQVRTSLNHLISTGEVTKQTTSKYTIVTICNYNDYQQDDIPTVSQMTSNRQADDKQSTTNKNDKNEKNNTESSLVSVTNSYIDLFNQLTSKNYKVTDKRTNKLKTRLKTFTYEQIEKSLKNMLNNPFYKGKNDTGWEATPEWFIENDERVDKFLNAKSKSSSLNPL